MPAYMEDLKMKWKKMTIAVLLAGTTAFTCLSPTTQAFNFGSLFGSVLKTGGVAFLVDQFSKPLNAAVNALYGQNGVSTSYATKVVPIISLGNGSYVGAAQVTGPQDKVDKTKAVLQLDKDFDDSRFKIKGLVPINANRITDISRVQGVGVSAEISVRI